MRKCLLFKVVDTCLIFHKHVLIVVHKNPLSSFVFLCIVMRASLARKSKTYYINIVNLFWDLNWSKRNFRKMYWTFARILRSWMKITSNIICRHSNCLTFSLSPYNLVVFILSFCPFSSKVILLLKGNKVLLVFKTLRMLSDLGVKIFALYFK